MTYAPVTEADLLAAYNAAQRKRDKRANADLRACVKAGSLREAGPGLYQGVANPFVMIQTGKRRRR